MNCVKAYQEVQEEVWTVTWDFTLSNYEQVLSGKDYEYTNTDGTVEVIPGDDMSAAFLITGMS